jgi:ankyrin repeat protein
MQVAALNGNLNLLRCLVEEYGADVNEEYEGYTPLLCAAHKGHVALVCYMVRELGVDVRQAGVNGCTPLHIAAREGKLDVVVCLVRELDADVNKAADEGSTPLYIAALGTWLLRYAPLRSLVLTSTKQRTMESHHCK